MCTVIFHPRPRGYLVGMNRDEQRTRSPARAPRHHTLGGRKMIFPSEPGGGTWVGVNEAGITLTLINWYAVPAVVTDRTISRGRVVRATLPAGDPDAVAAGLCELPLDRLRPFRLIGFFPGDETVGEWLWDGRRLDHLVHPWHAGIWISSGHDERGAQAVRTRVFQQARRQPGAGSPAWLRGLLASHLPTAGAYSICMHRDDAVTVSRTIARISGNRARLEYRDGTPCNPESRAGRCELSLRRAPTKGLAA